MANPPRQKGTSGETEVVNAWNAYFGTSLARRNPPAAIFDVTVERDLPVHAPIQVLATRPDRGQWLYTLTQDAFLELFASSEFDRTTPVHIEVKRYARFSLHSIFEGKFGRARHSRP